MNQRIKMAKFGAAATAGIQGKLPVPFPRTIGPNAMAYIQEVVESGLSCDMMGRFELTFADMLGVKHCIATPGCTPALAVLVAALRLAPGDEIVVSPISDYGTVAGLIQQGLIPVFADTAPDSINISADTIKPCISSRTRAILCVHKTGLLCDMDPICALGREHDLPVIEDVCQAAFGRYKGRLAGTLGDAAAFSFDPEKTIGSDTGGCLVTNDDELAEYARFVGHSRGGVMAPGFGRTHTVPGFAHRMPQCTAAVTLAQLEIAHTNVQHRDSMIRYLYQLLAPISGIEPLAIPAWMDVYSCWMAGFRIDPKAFRCDVDTLGDQMQAAGIPGIGTARYYLLPDALPFLQQNAKQKLFPYSQPPASREYDYQNYCPNARAFLQTFLRWSTFCEKYTERDCEQVAQIVSQVAERNRV